VKHEVAWWAAVAAFFGSLLTIGVVDILKPDDLIKMATSLIIAVITGGSVYAKQRLDEARQKEHALEQQRQAQS
jgi:hypothetical protein